MIYLDNAATTRVLDEAVKAATKSMTEGYGNPESLHGFGLAAEHTVSEARKRLASSAGVSEEEVKGMIAKSLKEFAAALLAQAE